METRISVIIPIYNTEKWLRECLDSVVNQIVSFDEVILVNDGSTDSSFEICTFYKSKFNYFKLISQENKGQSVARNIGIQNASGDYIMFLDSDDYLRNDTVKILKQQLKTEQYDAIFFDSDIHHMYVEYQVDRNIYDRSNSALDKKVWNGWEYFSKCYPRDYVVSVCMAVFRKQIIDDAELTFPEKVYYEDNYFSYMFLIYAQKVIHISEKLYQRRYRENSTMTSLFSEKKFGDFIKVCQLIWEDCNKNNLGSLPQRNKLLFSFFSDDYINILNNYQTCLNHNIKLGGQSISLLSIVSENYLNIIKKMNSQIVSMNLSDLGRFVYILHHMKRWNLVKKTEICFQIEEIIKLQKILYIDILKKCLLNKKGNTIGIYGTGKHTEGMLAIYERLFGKIESNLIFIDTRKDNGIYKNRNIINYKKINDQKFDLIVISSFVYEREMMNHVKEICSDIPIYTFYNVLNGDIFSDYGIFLEYC